MTDFWSHVQIGDGLACWEWQRSRTDRGGYGKLWRDGKLVRAHRVAWELTYGQIPEGSLVLHRCDNPPCCNPAHLFLGTHQDNHADMHAKGRYMTAKRRSGYRASARKLRGRAGLSGERNGRAVLSALQVADIRARYLAGGISQSRLGSEYGVSQVMISHIVLGRSWR